MKKIITLSFVVFGIVVLAGCGQQQTSRMQPTTLKNEINNETGESQDEFVRLILVSVMNNSLIYQDKQGTLVGFVPDFGSMPSCSGKPIINISPDGKSMAIFVKSCSGDRKYFCVDINSNPDKVDESYALSGKFVCHQSDTSKNTISATATNSVSDPRVFNVINESVQNTIATAIVYQDEHESLNGFVTEDLNELPKCSGSPIVNVSSDKQSMAIFVNLCSEDGKYYCNDTDSNYQEVDKNYAQSGKFTCPKN